MTTEEKPLFRPGRSLIGNNIVFICNINDEVSLWRVDATLRAYVANSVGVWLDTEEHLMRQVDNAALAPNARTMATIIARNADALAAYMGMLGGVRHP